MKPEDVKYLVVHCSKTSVKQGDGIRVVERKCRLRGALSCGYHFVISRDGTIEKGRRIDEAGNHLLGYNDRSLGICIIGMPGRITDKQRASLQTLLDILREQFPGAEAYTHADLDQRTGRDCPGFKLK